MKSIAPELTGMAAILLSVCLFTLSGCSTAAPPETLAWVRDFGIDAASVKPLRMNKHFPIPEIPVEVSGATVYLELDAGTPHGLMLTNASAKNIQYRVIERTRELNADGSDRGSDSLRVVFDSVSVLGEKTEGVDGKVADWKIYSSLPFGGTVSFEMLGAKSIVLDYKNRYYAISERPIPDGPNSARYGQASALAVPDRFGSNMYFYGSMSGKEIVIYLDTGSSESAVDPSIVAAAGFAQTGPAKQPYCKSVSFEVGGHGLTMKNIRVKRISPGVSFDKPVALVLGADFLKDRVLAVDRTGPMRIIIGDAE